MPYILHFQLPCFRNSLHISTLVGPKVLTFFMVVSEIICKDPDEENQKVRYNLLNIIFMFFFLILI